MAESNRIQPLDSVRGIASMVVVIFHTLISLPIFYAAFNYLPYNGNQAVKLLNDTPLHILWAGPEAVLLFFVLSGFVLSIPYLRNTSLPYSGYIIRRFFRIYIPYIVIMIIYIIIVSALNNYNPINSLSIQFNGRWNQPVTGNSIISYIFMLGNDKSNVNGVIWSLVHEMRISIIFPFLMILIKRFNLRQIIMYTAAPSILICIFLKYIAEHIPSVTASQLSQSAGDTFYYCLFFIIGASLCKYMPNIKAVINPLKPVYKTLLLIAAIFLIEFRWLLPGVFNKTSEALSFIRGGVTGDWVAGIGVALLFIVILNSIKLSNFLSRGIFVWIGKVSYSLYLVHVLVIMLCARYLGQVIPLKLSLLIAPLLALPVAYISFRYIEKPAMEIGRRLSARFKRG